MPTGPPSLARFGGGQLPASVSTRRFRAFARPDHDAGTLRSSPPALPLDIRAAFWYGVVGKGKPSAMAAATTRFSGRTFSGREMALIREVVRDCPGLSRMELARTVCELLRWWRANGRLKARECREFLERLDAEGALALPDKRLGRVPGSVTRVPRTAAGEPGCPLVGSVRISAEVEHRFRPKWNIDFGRSGTSISGSGTPISGCGTSIPGEVERRFRSRERSSVA